MSRAIQSLATEIAELHDALPSYDLVRLVHNVTLRDMFLADVARISPPLGHELRSLGAWDLVAVLQYAAVLRPGGGAYRQRGPSTGPHTSQPKPEPTPPPPPAIDVPTVAAYLVATALYHESLGMKQGAVALVHGNVIAQWQTGEELRIDVTVPMRPTVLDRAAIEDRAASVGAALVVIVRNGSGGSILVFRRAQAALCAVCRSRNALPGTSACGRCLKQATLETVRP